MRTYRRKKRGLHGSRLSEDMFSGLLSGFLGGFEPALFSHFFNVPPKTVRFAYERFRRFLGAQDTPFFYAAFGIWNQYFDCIGPYDLRALKMLALPEWFDEAAQASAHACFYNCPASLSPLRLRNAKSKEGDKPQNMTLIDPIPGRHRGPEGHNRHICNNCEATKLRACMNATAIDEIAVQISSYRKINATNFREYVLPATLVAIDHACQLAYLGKIPHDTGMDRPALDRVRNVCNKQIHVLADQMINGRKLSWDDVLHL